MSGASDTDSWLARHVAWEAVLRPLRRTLRATGMDESIKWGMPVYTLDGANVAALAAFRDHAAVWFFQGALLADPAGLLINAQPGRTQAQRQWRFSGKSDLDLEQLARYLEEAMQNERDGRRVEPRRGDGVPIPEELSEALANDPELAESFAALMPGRRREYAAHIGDARRAETRQRRLATCLPLIRSGQGLNDRYRK